MLINGESAPFTGEFFDITRLRNSAFMSYVSGNGVVTLEFESPFFEGSGVPFYQFPNLINRHSAVISLSTPVKSVRATCSGNGAFWVALVANN